MRDGVLASCCLQKNKSSLTPSSSLPSSSPFVVITVVSAVAIALAIVAFIITLAIIILVVAATATAVVTKSPLPQPFWLTAGDAGIHR